MLLLNQFVVPDSNAGHPKLLSLKDANASGFGRWCHVNWFWFTLVKFSILRIRDQSVAHIPSYFWGPNQITDIGFVADEACVKGAGSLHIEKYGEVNFTVAAFCILSYESFSGVISLPLCTCSTEYGVQNIENLSERMKANP